MEQMTNVDSNRVLFDGAGNLFSGDKGTDASIE